MKIARVFLTALIIFGCADKTDPRAEAIKASVIQNAMGQDIGYSPLATTKVTDMTHRDMLDVFLMEMEAQEKPIDTLIMYTEAAREVQRRENDSEMYHLFDYYVGRLKQYESAPEKTATAYSVYKHDYTIINPLFNNAKVNVTGYYFFTPNDSLIGRVGEDEFKDYKKNFIQTPSQPFEKMRYSFYK